ncbi:MAG TPA: glycosyltransferase family 2 protein [Patescibacteria group bacterium]|nr:glycosyltransferase family 2 protein [Patescibacteria group bacterium]
MKAAIILPTYNEKDNIEPMITVLQKEVFPTIKNYEMHIVVVDDSSTDGTSQIVEKLVDRYAKNLHLIKNGPKEGLGAAYIRGMSQTIEKLNADVLFEMDADGQHDPQKIPVFLKKIDEGYDMVIGNRFSDGGSIPQNWPTLRKAYSIIANLFVRAVLGRFHIHDWTGGYRALKKEVFLKEKEKLKGFKGYTFQVAFLHNVVKDGYRVAEVPFHFTDRTLGKSKIASGEYIFNLLRYILTARFWELVRSPFLKYAITGFLGYLINAVSLEVFSAGFAFHTFLAAVLASELSIIWNFFLNNFWSFSKYQVTSPGRFLLKFLQFNLVSAGSVLINSTIVFLGTHLFGNTTFVRQLSLIIAIGFFVIPYSYSMYNIFIWKRWRISFLARFQDMVG